MSSYSNITDSSITDIRTQPDFKIVAPSGLISEFILFWINLVNVGYTSLNGHSIQGDACKIVGGMVAFIVTSNLTLVGLISLSTYLRVCKKITLEMGRYDYRFFLIICLISILISLVGINDYGPSRFWCYNSPSNPITPLITISLIFLILFITSFCYIMTLLEVNIQQSGIGNVILYISYEGWTNRYGESKNCSTNASSGYSETNQESYPQIKIHDVEKENLTSRSSTLNLPNQEL
ncbi:19717_t:CDS:2 [Gigaspora margarita]|uniref:19717_t:CDS:1 n=1 Tax=Gigaspora margarita TaxID=4874 RepID=A0ABN7UF82_GIGMA|nr:19717_t:CDS:2 [Gigaspora margarita]